MSFVLITLQATYRHGANSGSAPGTVTFTPTEWRTSTVDNIIYVPDGTQAEIDGEGGLAVGLGTRNDVNDVPYSYQVSERIAGVTRNYEITLPVAEEGAVINLADVQPDGTWAAADIIPGGFGGF